MVSKSELYLSGTISPLGLLKCKNRLYKMAPGDILEIFSNDSDIVDDLIKIIERSPDRILNIEQKAGEFCIKIQKGQPSKP